MPNNKIKEWRRQTGLSQSKFAEQLGVSTRALQSWEQGWRNPPKAILKFIKIVFPKSKKAS